MNQANTKDALRNRVDEIAEVLYTGTFTVRDFEGDRAERMSKLTYLTRTEAVQRVGTETYLRDGNRKQRINVWKWKSEIQGVIQEHYENRNELPCGDRAHIPAETDENGNYLCKFCGDKHSREIIKNAL